MIIKLKLKDKINLIIKILRTRYIEEIYTIKELLSDEKWKSANIR